MYRYNIYIVLLSICFISACVYIEHKPSSLTLPPHRITESGISLIPPNEAGWERVFTDASHIVLQNKKSDPAGRFSIIAQKILLPTYSSNEEFLNLIGEGKVKHTLPWDNSIEKVIIEEFPANPARCVWAHLFSNQQHRADYKMLDRYILICSNSFDSKTGARVIFIHEYAPGHENHSVKEKAIEVFKSFLLDSKS